MALQKAFKDRKRKKREMRSVWIQQINAGARLYGLSYSGLISGLSAANVIVDRKILSELAMFEPYSFRALTKVAAAKQSSSSSATTATTSTDHHIMLEKTAQKHT